MNNRGFEIQRRTGSSGFITIGFVSGHGTTTELNNYSFVDNNITENLYVYRLKQYDYNGSYHYSDEVEVQIDILPEEFSISQNFPNPFNPVTTIRYSVPVMSSVQLEIYNVLGEVVKVIVNELQAPGHYEVVWNASAEASGVYFYRLTARSSDGKLVYSSNRKMIVIK
jgi:hypothetical protein